jgi:hypothetical protein
MISGLQRLTSLLFAAGIALFIVSVIAEAFSVGDFPTLLLAQVVIFLLADLLFLKMVEQLDYEWL